MRRIHFRKICVAAVIGVVGTFTCGVWNAVSQQPQDTEGLVKLALQDGSQAGVAAIAELRARGPEAVKYLMTHADLRQSPRWSVVLDNVAQQRDAQFCGLYWYTNLDQALKVAKQEKKPVLSLRLLGNLNEELSCANSRYFRMTLYPNKSVRDLLAEKFVLHWQSVRSVPVITIDFGDGRLIKRTITGNSLHLVLDDLGRPIDVLPGLYGAMEFVRELQASGPAALQLAQVEGAEFQKQRAAFHQDRLKVLTDRWNSDCVAANVAEALPIGNDQNPLTWSRLAGLHFAEFVPTQEAQQAVQSKKPQMAEMANLQAMTKARAETPMLRIVRNIGNSVGEDTVRNQYYFHACIHNWFAHEQLGVERDPLVTRVYSQLFLSPLNDPWYGLSRPDAYSALPQDGRFDAVTQNTRH